MKWIIITHNDRLLPWDSSQKLNMKASLNRKLPQEGTGEAGESLPESNSGCPSYSGGGKNLLRDLPARVQRPGATGAAGNSKSGFDPTKVRVSTGQGVSEVELRFGTNQPVQAPNRACLQGRARQQQRDSGDARRRRTGTCSGAARRKRQELRKQQEAEASLTNRPSQPKRPREVSTDAANIMGDPKIHQSSFDDTPNAVKMAIVAAEYTVSGITVEIESAIRTQIFDRLESAPDPLPLIEIGGLSSGALQVLCHGAPAVEWLQSLTDLVAEGLKLKVVRAKDLKAVKMAWKYKSVKAEVSRVLRMLQRLNPTLHTEEWRLVHSTVEAVSTRHIVYVDHASADVIKAAGYCLSAGVCKSNFKLLEPSEKSEKPADADARGEAAQSTPEAMSSVTHTQPRSLEDPSEASADTNVVPMVIEENSYEGSDLIEDAMDSILEQHNIINSMQSQPIRRNSINQGSTSNVPLGAMRHIMPINNFDVIRNLNNVPINNMGMRNVPIINTGNRMPNPTMNNMIMRPSMNNMSMRPTMNNMSMRNGPIIDTGNSIRHPPIMNNYPNMANIQHFMGNTGGNLRNLPVNNANNMRNDSYNQGPPRGNSWNQSPVGMKPWEPAAPRPNQWEAQPMAPQNRPYENYNNFTQGPRGGGRGIHDGNHNKGHRGGGNCNNMPGDGMLTDNFDQRPRRSGDFNSRGDSGVKNDDYNQGHRGSGTFSGRREKDGGCRQHDNFNQYGNKTKGGGGRGRGYY